MPTLEYIDCYEDDEVEVIKAPTQSSTKSPTNVEAVKKPKPPTPVSNTKSDRKVPASGSKRKNAPAVEGTAVKVNSKKVKNQPAKGQLKLGSFFSKAKGPVFLTKKKNPKEGLSLMQLKELKEICLGKEIQNRRTPEKKADKTTFVSPNDDELEEDEALNAMDHDQQTIISEEDPEVGTEALEKALGASSAHHSPMAVGKSSLQKIQELPPSSENVSSPARNGVCKVTRNEPINLNYHEVLEEKTNDLTCVDLSEPQKNQEAEDGESKPPVKTTYTLCSLEEKDYTQHPRVSLSLGITLDSSETHTAEKIQMSSHIFTPSESSIMAAKPDASIAKCLLNSDDSETIENESESPKDTATKAGGVHCVTESTDGTETKGIDVAAQANGSTDDCSENKPSNADPKTKDDENLEDTKSKTVTQKKRQTIGAKADVSSEKSPMDTEATVTNVEESSEHSDDTDKKEDTSSEYPYGTYKKEDTRSEHSIYTGKKEDESPEDSKSADGTESKVDTGLNDDESTDGAESKIETGLNDDESTDGTESKVETGPKDSESEGDGETEESVPARSQAGLKKRKSKISEEIKKAHPNAAAIKTKGKGRKSKTVGSTNVLDDESQIELAKYRSIRDSYAQQAKDLLASCCELNQNELLPVPQPEHGDNVVFVKESFPDFAVQQLCARIEGHSLTLSALADRVTEQLNQAYHTKCFEPAVAAEKIKLVATRRNYIKSPHVVDDNILQSPTPDPMQDQDAEFVWRWEVDVMELLPADCATAAKKARASLKRASMPFNAIAKIILLLTDLEKVISAGGSGSQVKREKLVARIRQEEEKLVKLQEAKKEVREKRKRKSEEQDLKDRKREEQRKLKQQLVEDKKRQKLLAEEQKLQALKEKELQKEEAIKEKEAKKQAALEAKRLKDEEAHKAEQEKKAKVQKQANLMMSFLAKSKRADKKPPEPTNVTKPSANESSSQVTASSSILPLIGSGEDCDAPSIFPMKLSERAKKYRRPRCKTVERTVFVTSQDESDDPWATERPFAEERTVQLRSLFKLLRFGGEHRPAYYGTWSKKSKLITGRRPFIKDTQFFDYDYDSADDWEEGDDEVGEELGDDDEDDVEPDDDEKLPEDEDGWLAADDDNDDDVDEETRHLRKKMRLELENRTNTALVLIGPCFGGKPLSAKAADDDGEAYATEGIERRQAVQLLISHKVLTVQDCDASTVLDAAFPPAMTEETSGSGEDGAAGAPEKKLSEDEMKIFLGFVHNNTLASKEKVVDQLRSELLPSLSRSMALKTLETVADKKKHPVRGFLWEVKRELLDQWGLSHLAAEDDAAELKRQHLRRMAQLVHHSTATSKEKLADELLAAATAPASDGENAATTMSKAESLRLVLQLGTKCKAPSGSYYWQVRDEVQRDLNLTLPEGAPAHAESTINS